MSGICSSQGLALKQGWGRRCGAFALGLGIGIKAKINVLWRDFCLLGWLEAELYVSRCTGGARKGSVRPVSIGSSHCLTQYGCKG